MDTSYLAQQVTTIIGQLHSLFDDIGVPTHERESREAELFSALSETLHNQLRLVTTEKHEITEEAHRLIKTIRQMEKSLDDTLPSREYEVEDADLKVTYPLSRCLASLKEKHVTISKLHRERYEQVKKLVQALESYASHLEPSFVTIKLPPTSPNATISPTFDLSPSYVAALDTEFSRVYEEYTRRVSLVKCLADEIIKLWAELGTPQAQTDGAIVKYAKDAPEQLGLHQEDLNRMKAKRDKLVDEKKGRERRLKELRSMIEGLWDRLGIEEAERKGFLNRNRGCGLRIINEFEDELARLNELKRQNLHLFVEDARYKLQELWDGLYFSEEEMLEFTPAFSDVYSDALLSAHEAEIVRLETLKEQRAPTLALIDRHRSLIKDRDDLTASSQDASRLMLKGQKGERRDPGKLLREEKMRKRIAKELPKVEADLRKTLEAWEDEYGRPFLVHGERYLDELAAASARPVPPRSKTPQPQSTVKPPKSAPASQKAATVRGAPPPRPKTPGLGSSVHGTIRGNPLASSVSAASLKSGGSPSKIPSRVPLNNTSGNSPERRYRTERDNEATIRRMPPPRMPPPKMKDLFVPPPVTTPISTRSDSSNSDYSNQMVRATVPEDVYYDERAPSRTGGYGNLASSHSTHSSQSYFSASSARAQYPQAPRPPSSLASSGTNGSRQPSNTSSTDYPPSSTTATSGSENWETYDDASEPEPEKDGSEAYYARLRRQQMQQQQQQQAIRNKRFTPEGGYGYGERQDAGKRVRGPDVVHEEQYGYGEGALVRVDGSDAGWTDDGSAY